jgi:hypothetical protein
MIKSHQFRVVIDNPRFFARAFVLMAHSPCLEHTLRIFAVQASVVMIVEASVSVVYIWNVVEDVVEAEAFLKNR